jgi:hypothetical protein
LIKTIREPERSRVSKALLQIPFATVAAVAEHQPEELMKELKLNGISIERKEETIQEIAARNNKRGADILNVIFELIASSQRIIPFETLGLV